jgi:predicted AAA+ superfamily ATPase
MVFMQKAESLRDAYNVLSSEPLKAGEEARAFYVRRPDKWPSPLHALKDRIEVSNRKEKYLFLGFRGSGKSTELNLLEAELDKERFIVVNYSIKDDVNESDFDFRDFFVSMALRIYDTAKANKIDLHKDIKEE